MAISHIEQDIPKTINTNGIFLNMSTDEHLDILYNALADVKSKPIQPTHLEYVKPDLSVISNHPKTAKQYKPLKLNTLQKKILGAL